MATQRTEGEEQEALFNSYPCTALYFVQSPSTASHANSSTHSDRNPSSESTLLSPFPHENYNKDTTHFTLSRYSSSRGSNNSYVNEKKISESILKSGRLRIVDRIGEDVSDGDEEVGGRGKSGVWRFVALDPSSSCCCIVFQVLWRLLLSIGVALFVFFLVSKPPLPRISFKVADFIQFSLREGLDNTGVITKILSSNCSVNMEIDNDSKVFGLHVHSPTVEMDFGGLKLGRSQGPESFVKSDSSYVLNLYVSTKDRPVYGAGRSMQDMLESGEGLPLMIRVWSRSSYRVVWNLIKLRFLHHEECLLLLFRAVDQKHSIHIHNSTCTTSTHHA